MQDLPYMDTDVPDVRGNRARDRKAQPENNSKLVLLFFIMVIGTYTAIVNHHFHLPDAEGSTKTHRKHLRLENRALRDQFQSHVLNRTRKAGGAVEVLATGQVQQPLDSGSSSSSSSIGASAIRTAGMLSPVVREIIKNDAAVASSGVTAQPGGAQGAPGGEVLLSMEAKQQAVKGAMVHAWTSYEKHAWGMDELLPISLKGKNSFAGMGATILDSLSTLWIMGLKDEFARGRDFVNSSLVFPMTTSISLFETNIRVVGGLMSAYDLSGDNVFLQKTQQLVDLMLPAMGPDDNSTGIPRNSIILGRAAGGMGGTSSIAECGSLQLEWCTLSLRTGNEIYAKKALKVFDSIHAAYPGKGLIPTTISRSDASGTVSYSMGAAADSYYEYLLKVWMLRGKKDEVYRSMWELAIDEAIEKLVGVTGVSKLMFVGTSDGGPPTAHQEHLACFFPGNVALGVHTGAVTGAKAERYMEVAKGITRTCWEMYDRMPTGLAAEAVNLVNATDKANEMVSSPAYYILRPETVESFFYMWRFTGDPMYRDWGWKVFQSIEKNCRVEGGYAGTGDVSHMPIDHDDTMQSFFLAETLKYLYLLFSPPEVMPLDEWVFNTEAHPFRLPALQAKAAASTARRRKLTSSV